MSAQQGKTNLLLGKLGKSFVDAHEKNKTNAVKLDSGGDLPAGVQGIARLVECKIKEIEKGKQNAGQLVFYAAGIVVKPKEHEGIPIEGMRTQIIEPIFDTPTKSRKTVSDHIAWIYNQLKLLGIPVEKLTPQSIEPAMEALKKAQPFFKFRTWKGQKAATGPYKDKEPMVNHIWNGVITMENPTPAPNSGVVDNTTTEEETVPEDMVVEETTTTEEVTTQSETTEESPNIDSLVADSVAGDPDAQTKLADLARAAGMAEDILASADTSWEQIGEFVKNPLQAEETSISVGDQFNFKPLDARTKQPVKNPVLVEIVEFTENDTVTIKNVAKPTILYKNIPMSSLEDVS